MLGRMVRERQFELVADLTAAIATSRTPPSPASGWGCRLVPSCRMRASLISAMREGDSQGDYVALRIAPRSGRTTAQPSITFLGKSCRLPPQHFDLFRCSVRCGRESYRRLGVDHGLFLARCRCHSGPRSRAHGRADQSALTTTSQSADEGAPCGTTAYFGYIALRMAFAFSTKSAS